MRDYLKRSWVNPKLVAGASRIHDEGVFASAPIARGEKLMEFGGERITREQADSDAYHARSVWLTREGFYLARPASDGGISLDEHLNHSCDANAWLADDVTLLARRDIAAGEEITLDQGTWNFDDAEFTWDGAQCGCGAPDCRKVLSENDWMLASVRTRYREHFHPAVQKLIEARKR